MKIKITSEQIQNAEQCLVDNGIPQEEAQVVLQALGYILLDTELYSDNCTAELCENEMGTAEWEPDYTTEDGNFYTCSNCHTSIGFAGEPTIKHCPECGSRMTNCIF